ncbi:MAG: hypothetical protein ABI634_14325 [Acidobacteriota bacterium]
MRGVLRTLIRATAACWAAVAVYVGLTLPPPRVTLDSTMPATHALGGYHIHTLRSDGSGTVDNVAEAARRSGLQFLIFTDHGDATRVPDAPTYRHGVLCIDAVEISTREGHIVALGLNGSAPYPLAGAARDVIDDIHRLGGRAVLAHPDSPSAALRWTGQGQGFDGIEWLNGDSEWRDKSPWRLLATAARSVVRPSESIASLFSRPVRTLVRWDAADRQRPVFGLAALDAHARIGWSQTEEPRGPGVLQRPTYAAMFGTVAQVAVLDTAPSGDANRDAAAVLSAIVGGRSYSIVRAFGGPAALRFSGDRGAEHLRMGDRAPAGTGPMVFHAEIAGAPGAALALYADGRVISRGAGAITSTSATAGVYRIEASWPGASVPWIVSNPIVLTDDRVAPPRAPEPAAAEQRPIAITLPSWTIESEPSSAGQYRVDDERLRFDYRLGGGAPNGQYAALVVPVASDAGIDRVEATVRADRPMRMSLQVRMPAGRGGQRWRRSIYVDETPRLIAVRLQDFEPADAPTTRRPIVAPIETLLFVVDTVNSPPGRSGTVWISNVTLGIDRLR